MSSGLSADEVAQRVARGAVNAAPQRGSRTVAQILRANLLTRFNALIGALCVLVLIIGHPIDALFGWVIVINSAVGVVQELRAKRTLDRLALVGQAPVRVCRDGRESPIAPGEVVLDDLVLLGPGDKVPVDGQVHDADGLEIDESLLTGEADPVTKNPGDEVLSGSFVVAGHGGFTATRVGTEAYAARLAADASRFAPARSQLMTDINHFLRLITWAIVAVGGLLVARQFTLGAAFGDSVIGSVAGVVPMIPEGLVLLTSAAFAVGVVRLGRRNCLVQELPAVEVLARVDLLCVDKTGTLTEGGMLLREIRPVDGTSPELARAALAALARMEPNPNPTMQAIAAGLGGQDGRADAGAGWQPQDSMPFSSARKYSGASFGENGTWLVGAPEVLLAAGDAVRAEADQLAGHGLRVLALARASGLPGDGTRRPAALVALEQRIRPTASDTLAYFAKQGVTVKVLSGDNARSVAAIARQVGLPTAGDPVDARTLPEDRDELAAVLDAHAVFGRVTPQQKRVIVEALGARGHTVAMTGDGVNDVLALKRADLGIAMGSGSAATRAIAKVVLLDDNFTALPQVVAEGRRVLTNIERVANLFLTKTVYSILLALMVGVAHLPFPFLPRHVTLVATLTIGVPGFFLALAPTGERARPGFIPRVLRFAVPAGAVAAVAAFGIYGLSRLNRASNLAADRSAATLALFLVAFWALALIARPYNAWRIGLLAAMGGLFTVTTLLPQARHVAALSFPDWRQNLASVGLALVGCAVLALLLRVDHWTQSQWRRPQADRD